MQTALEKLLEYVEENYTDETLDSLIEEVNGICGTIERINKRINIVEEEKSIFGSISTELELELKRLKNNLNVYITIL